MIQAETVVIPPPAHVPGTPITGVPGITAKIRYDPSVEYVADGAFGSSYSYARSLPEYIDDVTRDFGADLYDRMCLDAQVQGDIKALKLSVLASGVSILPAVGEGQPRYKQAIKIKEFCERLIGRLEITPVLYDMLGALATGNRVAELVWEKPTSGTDAGRIVLARIKVKHRRSVALVVDNRGNVAGVLGALAGRAQNVVRQGMVVDPANTPQFLPRGKFAILTHAPADSDPRGTSVLRAAYSPWWMKQQAFADLLRHLAQVGGGVLLGFAPEDASVSSVPDGMGGYTVTTPEQAMLAQLMQIRGGACAAFPNGADVRALAVTTAAAPFFDAINLYDAQISKSILGQTLATNEGKHQSRAATGEQKDIFDLIVEFEEVGLGSMLRRDILTHAVVWNFGEGARDLVPLVTLSKVVESDLGGLAEAVAKLQTSGYLTASQLPALDAKLGLPVRIEAAPLQQEETGPSPPDETNTNDN